MIKIGARVHDYGKGTPKELFERISADGFETVQLACKKALSQISNTSDITPDVLAQIKSELENNSLSVGVYGSYVELSLADDAARKLQVKEFCSNIPLAKVLQAGCIGSETTNMEKQPGVTRSKALRALRASMEEILPVAQAHGVVVAVEPVVYHALNTPEEAALLLRDMASPNLKIIFDPVNLLDIHNFSSREALFERAFECFGDEIVAVHLKGVNMGEDGTLVKTGFADSAVNYEKIMKMTAQLGRDLPVLREELVPESAARDCTYLKSLK